MQITFFGLMCFFFLISGATPPAAAVQLPSGDAAHSPAAFHPRPPLHRQQQAHILRRAQRQPLLPVLIGGKQVRGPTNRLRETPDGG